MVKNRPHRKIGNMLQFYRRHYRGMPRGQLAEKDPSLYQLMYNDGSLEQVPRQHRDLSNPLGYYHEHYEGLTRSEIFEKDRSLYQTLWKKNLLRFVPKENG
ncbi:MAG: hypothetical protein HY366_02900 [Candidatus Aenigmarchaeota archaeon]|nr:hypothetical protein [Candidatus Aenigmarchaeota archaeon]